MNVATLLELFLPYYPELVAAYEGHPGGSRVPPIRCADDRPMETRYRWLALHAATNLAFPIFTVDVGEARHGPQAFSPEVMLRNSRSTGASFTGGMSGVIGAYVVSWSMSGIGQLGPDAVSITSSTLTHLVPGCAEDHDHCAGRAALPEMVGSAAEQPEDVLRDTLLIAPGVDQSRFGAFVDAARATAAEPRVFSMPDHRLPATLRPVDGGGETEHRASFIAAVQSGSGAHVLWDTRLAWQRGTPGYALNVGLSPYVAAALCSLLGGKEEDVAAALVYLSGASVKFLPRPSPDQPLEIHVVP